MVHMKTTVRSALAGLGLLEPLQRARREVRRVTAPVRDRIAARGWIKWSPLVPEQAFTRCAAMAIATLQARGHVFGDYLEFGVSRGTSLACMSEALEQAALPDVRMIGFDSFEGLPEEAAEEGWRPGQFASTEAATRRYLEERGARLDRIHLVKGWFSDTLDEATKRELGIERASLIMIDCDIYSASREALRFCAPMIKDHAVIFFDDWGWREQAGSVGQKEAFAEFLDENTELSAEPLNSYFEHARVFLVKRSR